jgi:hypothetical protein
MDVITLLVSTGAATIIVALITAVFNRRKLSAEATQIITQAAAGTVENIMKDNAALRTELCDVKSELAKLTVAVANAEKRERAHAAIEERYRWHLDRWHRYTKRVTDELRALGGTIEDPPPMWPDLVMPIDEDDPHR